LWSLLYHYRGQQQTTELFSITEETLNIPSKQGSWERLVPRADPGSALERGPRLFMPHFILPWMLTGEQVWKVLGKPGLLNKLSLSSVNLSQPDIKNKH